jgi:hypothetical protein
MLFSFLVLLLLQIENCKFTLQAWNGRGYDDVFLKKHASIVPFMGPQVELD